MDKSELLKPRADTYSGFPEDDVEVPGGKVRVRAMSRWEMIKASGMEGKTLEAERFVLSRVMVDPQMNEDDIALWQKISRPMEINNVMQRVNELSGVARGADKEAYKSVRDEPEPGVRLLPGGEAADDGGRDAPTDER